MIAAWRRDIEGRRATTNWRAGTLPAINSSRKASARPAKLARVAIVLLAALGCALAGARVQAQAAQNARKLFERGNRELAARRYVAALELFLRVAKVTQRRSVTLNVGQTYRLLDLPHRALIYYKRYLKSSRRPRRLPYYADVKRFSARCRRVVALVKRAETQQGNGDCKGALRSLARAATESRWGRIDLRRAQCLSALGQTDAARRVAVRALQSYGSLVREWSATGARLSDLPDHAAIDSAIRTLRPLVRAVTTTRKRDPPPPPPNRPRQRPATVLLLGVPDGASVTVDGRERRAPGGRLVLAAGSYEIAVEADGRRWSNKVRLGSGDRVQQRVALAATSRKRRRTGWLIAGISLGALAAAAEIAGIVLAVKANQLFSDDPDFPPLRDGSVAGHVSAGILAAAAITSLVVYFFVPSKSSGVAGDGDGEHAGLLPTVTPRRGGATVGATLRF